MFFTPPCICTCTYIFIGRFWGTLFLSIFSCLYDFYFSVSFFFFLLLHKILDHLSLVPDQSRVAVYVRKTLAKKRVSGTSTTQEDRTDGERSSRTSSSKATKEGETVTQSPFLHDGLSLKDLVLLGEIIDKLVPETEHQGLRELYAFQQSHLDVDIPSLFRSVSSQ